MKEFRTFIVVVCVLLAGALSMGASKPFNHYLTYAGDPSTSIVVGYQTPDVGEATIVRYDTESRGGKARKYAHEATGAVKRVKGLKVERTVHLAPITGLQPNTTYYFVFGDKKHGFSEERSFRTLPGGTAPVRFATGGDMGPCTSAEKLLEQAAKLDPMFIAIGGDIAYANGDLKLLPKWDRWFEQWADFAVTPDGRDIPMIQALGNHEVNKSDSTDFEDRSPFYMAYFSHQADKVYYVRPISERVVLFVLDSGHLVPHGGAQRDWLASALEQHKDVSYRFAMYHVPLYPSHRPFDDSRSQAGREHWLPLFDQYKLTTAFENHDHTLKRTKLLRNGEESADGTLYLGDGCFGVPPRTVEGRHYEVHSAQKAHFWFVEVGDAGATYKAIDGDGSVLDQYPPATP